METIDVVSKIFIERHSYDIIGLKVAKVTDELLFVGTVDDMHTFVNAI